MKKLMSLLPLVSLFFCGCYTNLHDEVGWVASDYFDDPKVIKLCEAIEASNLNAMQAAVDAGADINAVGKDGMTPLMWALPDQKFERFEWLLKKGADPNVCWTGDFGTNKHHFTESKSVTYLSILIHQPEYYQLVLKYGGNPNLLCQGQRGPLLHAQYRWQRILALLDAGADIDAKSTADVTLLMHYGIRDNYDHVLTLLDRGASPFPYQESANRQFVHILIENEKKLPTYSEDKKKNYYTVVEKLKELGVDFDNAREDIKRWNSWPGDIKHKVKLHRQEAKRRLARQAEQEKQPELAEPEI